MIKQHRFDDPLEQIDPQIATGEVGQLVGNHRFQHVERHFGDPRRRDQNQRPHETHGHRVGNLFAEKNE